MFIAPPIETFSDRTSFEAQAGQLIFDILRNAIQMRGEAVMFCAGGSTPGPIYTQLAQRELQWKKVTVGLTDERWVPITSPASNEAMLKRSLLTENAASAHFLSMVSDTDKSPFDEQETIDTCYATAAGAPDILIVGMGPDSHTLSWFPDASGLDAALNPDGEMNVVAIAAKQSAVTGEHTERVTLTLPMVARSQHVLLLITGDEKKDVFESASADSPIGHLISAAGSKLKVLWSQ